MYQVDLIKAQIQIGFGIQDFWLSLKGLFIKYIQTPAAYPMLCTPPDVFFVYFFCSAHFYMLAFLDTGPIVKQQGDLINHEDPLKYEYFQHHCHAVLNITHINIYLLLISFISICSWCNVTKSRLKMNITSWSTTRQH